jgi:hypothetical protein
MKLRDKEDNPMHIDPAELKSALKELTQRFETLGGYL